MIDTDKYEELLENGMQHRDLWELAAELLAEVKRLREELALYRQGLIDGTTMYPDIYNYLPLYLRELIE